MTSGLVKNNETALAKWLSIINFARPFLNFGWKLASGQLLFITLLGHTVFSLSHKELLQVKLLASDISVIHMVVIVVIVILFVGIIVLS